MADAHVRLASIDLDKVARFTGPLGFDRRDGEVRVDMVTSIQIEPAGRVMMAGYADLTHEGERGLQALEPSEVEFERL